MNWSEIEEIAQLLEENYPDEDISDLKLSYLEEMIRAMPEFEDVGTETTRQVLEDIMDTWLEIRRED